MHKHRVAHRYVECLLVRYRTDCPLIAWAEISCWILLISTPSHFTSSPPIWAKTVPVKAKHFTRTQRPPKYYFIDFGISRRYHPSDANPREIPIWGGDKLVPEFQNSNEPRDPFPTDVFYIGNTIRMGFLLVGISLCHLSSRFCSLFWNPQEKWGFEFMKPLIASMVQADPDRRPKMYEVVAWFDDTRCGLSQCKLHLCVVDANKDLFPSGYLHYFPLEMPNWVCCLGGVCATLSNLLGGNCLLSLTCAS